MGEGFDHVREWAATSGCTERSIVQAGSGASFQMRMKPLEQIRGDAKGVLETLNLLLSADWKGWCCIGPTVTEVEVLLPSIVG